MLARSALDRGESMRLSAAEISEVSTRGGKEVDAAWLRSTLRRLRFSSQAVKIAWREGQAQLGVEA